jgi:hypothetical protein
MIGHKNATPAKGYTATPNIVVVRIFPHDDFSLHAMMPGRMESAMKSGLSELCVHFVKHCEANVNRFDSGLWLGVDEESARPIRVGDLRAAG